MRLNKSGNVGINTTAPTATLHVVGNMKIQAVSTANATPILNITNSTGQTNCVVAKHLNGDGFIITTYITDSSQKSMIFGTPKMLVFLMELIAGEEYETN